MAGRRSRLATMWAVVACVGSMCVWTAAGAEACPSCKEVLFDPRELPQRLSTARGYALSIGLLLLIPLGLGLAIAAGIVRTSRRMRALRVADARRDAASPSP